MTKHRSLLLFLCLSLFVTACSNQARSNDSDQESNYKDGREDKNHVQYLGTGLSNPSHLNKEESKLGYIRFKASQHRDDKQPDAFIDRNVLARQIGELVTRLSKVDECTVLVTDDHIFVGLDHPTSESISAAERTTASISPRYFDIHVTGDPHLRSKMEQIGEQVKKGETTSEESDNINDLLRQMGDHTPPIQQ
ncbi:YhcN/YlaJ family sporulation lipoprotein [Mechercharimyces sp. CAU 1602]|uniref:YhcN/YlaJ family sporulation lipoprotein n=1 Tax=Mechercharimyces sp. CAU 1602 TaxID=2973933 RepID=UPI002161523E|nr:YhcN/YlaJ family sporulation lipoprotein [Mechercharimyces sp. CAU 1602]MCS1351790.1 YhcN/YlaJ family sporulation lipoprotein [Mechercharimyces sp. CAU 1602]